MMSDDSTENEEESLFLSEMSDVKPLKADNRVRFARKPKKQPARSQQFDSHIIEDVFSTSEIIEDCPDILSFSRSGIQTRVLKNLRQGKFPIEDTLDLHGLTIEQARKALLIFLNDCLDSGIRHIIIVHGKGYRSRDKPVIKPMVNRWLRATESVLAFHSARPEDGGSGAIYVLLKKTG